MTLLERFILNIRNQQLFSEKDNLIIAVSGGLDSIVLCELCRQAGYGFQVAHCNFQLREAESERDENFVRELAKQSGWHAEVRRFDTAAFAAEKKISIQEAARELRYQWFDELVSADSSVGQNQPGHSGTYLLTAHQADDNIETLMMHFFRGTGLKGLTGIPEKKGHIRRPLLAFTRNEIQDFAIAHQLRWVEDSSNESSKYTRNYFRNELLPALENVYPQVKKNLADNISRFREIESLYRLSVEAIKRKLVRVKGEERHIPVKQLLGFRNRALIYEIIAGYGFQEKQTAELIRLASSESGHFIISPGGKYRIIKHRHWFIISPAEQANPATIVIGKGEKIIRFDAGVLSIKETTESKPETGDENQVTLDGRLLTFPWLMRKWKTGDYFYPLGMKKKKKIARFLIDLKLSRTEKEKVWVLESSGRICWVIGYRIDERFKLTGNTQQAFILRVERKS